MHGTMWVFLVPEISSHKVFLPLKWGRGSPSGTNPGLFFALEMAFGGVHLKNKLSGFQLLQPAVGTHFLRASRGWCRPCCRSARLTASGPSREHVPDNPRAEPQSACHYLVPRHCFCCSTYSTCRLWGGRNHAAGFCTGCPGVLFFIF